MIPAAIAVGGALDRLLERLPPSPRPLERHGERVQASGRVWVNQVAQAWVSRAAQALVSRVAQRVAESPGHGAAARTTPFLNRAAGLDPAGCSVSCENTEDKAKTSSRRPVGRSELGAA